MASGPRLVLLLLTLPVIALVFMPILLPEREPPSSDSSLSSAPYSAIVFGSTGQIGRAIVRELLASPSCVNVTLVVRLRYKWMSAERDAHVLRHWGLREAELGRLRLAVVQYDAFDRFAAALHPPQPQRHRVAFSAIGVSSFLRIPRWGALSAMRAVDVNFTRAAAAAVRAHGVEHFSLASSFGAHPDAYFDFFKAKGEMEAAVAALDFPLLSIFRPTVLLHTHSVHQQHHDTYIGDWLCRFVWPRVHWALSAFGLDHLKAVPAERLAKAMVRDAERAAAAAAATSTTTTTATSTALPYEWPTITTAPTAPAPAATKGAKASATTAAATAAAAPARTGRAVVFDNAHILSLQL